MSSASLAQRTVRRIGWAGIWGRLGCYWALIKDLQTGLLVLTAAAAYATGCCTNLHGGALAELAGSLLLAVSGCTILNMVYDRDIDARMPRTAARPLPTGRLGPAEALVLGSLLAVGGVVWAFAIDGLYGGVVLAGLLLDALVYTVWLKRRTPYAILIGGLSGGMPALAGRALATGQLDAVGLLLALGVLLWIPTHIMTFTIKYQGDYARAGIPTFPAVYGVTATRAIIAVSTVLAVAVFLAAGALVHLPPVYAQVAWGLGLALIGLVLLALVRPDARLNFVLYKGASVYMLGMMIVFILGGL
jgi:protoheme IX farnesyltransferase